nr:hypothetical protein [Mycoplasmopsis bovis]
MIFYYKLLTIIEPLTKKQRIQNLKDSNFLQNYQSPVKEVLEF